MVALLLFALTLLAAVLISDLAEHSIVSTAVLFLLVGFVAGDGVAGVVRIDPEAPLISELASLALFATLFTDGMRLQLRELQRAWRLPGRALLLGLPLGILVTAVLTHLITNLEWHWAFLLGAVLAPTDPVFAAALIEREEVPGSLRELLNIESGVNDGLALPIVLWLLHAGQPHSRAADLLLPLFVGVSIGIAVPWIAHQLEASRWFRTHESYRALASFAVALLVLTTTRLAQGNELLGAFAAGVTVISLRPEISDQFRGFAEHLASLLKFAALFIFGALIAPDLLRRLDAGAYVLVFLLLVLVRPLTLSISLLGSGMPPRQRAVAAWFGPKGFASVLYAVLVLRSHVAPAEHLFHLAAVVIAASIVLHSSTDLVAARWLKRAGAQPCGQSPPARVGAPGGGT